MQYALKLHLINGY